MLSEAERSKGVPAQSKHPYPLEVRHYVLTPTTPLLSTLPVIYTYGLP
jgi:hypothetical protein